MDEIRKYLGVSSDTVYRWIDRFGMPAYRMGRLWNFKMYQVEAGGACANSSKKDVGKDLKK